MPEPAPSATLAVTGAKTFLPWSLLVILGTAVVTYAVAHWADPQAPRAPALPPSLLRAIGRLRPRDETALPLDMATARRERLAVLDGKRARFRVVVDSTVDAIGDRDLFNVLVRDPADEGTVEFYPGQNVDDGMTVEGTPRVVHHRTINVGTTAVI